MRDAHGWPICDQFLYHRRYAIGEEPGLWHVCRDNRTAPIVLARTIGGRAQQDAMNVDADRTISRRADNGETGIRAWVSVPAREEFRWGYQLLDVPDPSIGSPDTGYSKKNKGKLVR